MTAATKIQWRVEARKTWAHKWAGKGLFETRSNAREKCKELRDVVGWGNARVVRYVKGSK